MRSSLFVVIVAACLVYVPVSVLAATTAHVSADQVGVPDANDCQDTARTLCQQTPEHDASSPWHWSLQVPAGVDPGTLTTAPANNGAGGIFLRLQAVAEPLALLAIDTPVHGNSGIPVQVEVWTRPGSYLGHVNSADGWTLSQTVTGTSQGASDPAAFDLTTPVLIAAGDTVSVYLQSVTDGAGIRFTGTSQTAPQTTWNNADIVLFSNTAMDGHVAFAGNHVTPRTFSGSVHYQVLDLETIFANGFEPAD